MHASFFFAKHAKKYSRASGNKKQNKIWCCFIVHHFHTCTGWFGRAICTMLIGALTSNSAEDALTSPPSLVEATVIVSIAGTLWCWSKERMTKYCYRLIAMTNLEICIHTHNTVEIVNIKNKIVISLHKVIQHIMLDTILQWQREFWHSILF